MKTLKYLFIILLLLSSHALAGTEYFAAPTPTGAGTDCTTGSPCTVSYALNTKMIDGDDLTLKDGTYDNALDMIIPPQTLDGTDGDHVVISAENDGEVFIDGGGTLTPVKLNQNDYFDLAGFNMANAGTGNNGRVLWVYESSHVTVKRVIGWDATTGIDENSTVFNVSASVLGAAEDVLFEDCAGWGGGRKIFQMYKMDDVTFRRNFFMWGGGTARVFSLGMTLAYQSTNTLLENNIGTWDETNQPKLATNRNGIFSADSTSAGGGYQILGNIAYFLAAQESGGGANVVARHFNLGEAGVDAASNITFTNNIAYTDRNDITPLRSPRTTGAFSYFTAIGGTYWSIPDAVQIDNQTGTFDYVIQMNSNKDGVGVDGNDFDYIWFFNNIDDYDGTAPANFTTGSDPDLIGNCGNILQYGCTTNIPEVGGQDVGAKIQYRYVDGVLTGDELWPWPMNDRIAAAMVDSGYDANGGLDGNGGTDLTNLIFSLGGGQGFGPYDVSPADGDTGVSITASATWNYLAYIDSVDVYLDKGTCVGVGKTTLVSDDDADKTYDMSTLDEVSDYCLVLVPNDGEQTGADHEIDFNTSGVPPPDPSGLVVVDSPCGVKIVDSPNGGTM